MTQAIFRCERSHHQDKGPGAALQFLPCLVWTIKRLAPCYTVCEWVCVHIWVHVWLNLSSGLSESDKQQKLRSESHRLLPTFTGNSLLCLTVRQEEKEGSVFKGFSQSLMLFITSHQLYWGVATCNCGHRSFGPKTTNQDRFLFRCWDWPWVNPGDSEMGHYLTWTQSDVKEH